MAAQKTVSIHDIRSVFAILAPQILNDWKFVLRRLGVSDSELQEIVSANRSRKPAELVYRGLIRWENLCHGHPSMQELIQTLKELKLDDAADSVAKYRVTSRPPPLAGYSYGPPRRRPRHRHHHPPPSGVEVGSRSVAGDSAVTRRPQREGTDDNVVKEIIYPMYRLQGRVDPVMVHPLATYREPPRDVLNMSFDHASNSAWMMDDRFKRHSWSTEPVSLLNSRLRYTYVSQLITLPSKQEREPWFSGVEFLRNGDVILLDKDNKRVEVHSCSILQSCRRYVFSHSFKIYKDMKGSEPSDIAIYESYVVVIDKGQRCLRIFTIDGKSTGSVKFRNQPRCVAVRGSTFAIAFWDLSEGKGSIVLYQASLEQAIPHGRKLTLVKPRHVESATECYDSVGLNSLGDVIALSQDGRLSLHSIKSALNNIYICSNESVLPRIRSMVVRENLVVVCNTYQDNLTAIGVTASMPHKFDLSNMNVILNEDDGLYAPRAMAFYNHDLVVIHKYGADVRVFGTMNHTQNRKGSVTFRI